MDKNPLAVYPILTTVDSAIPTLINEALILGIPEHCIDVLVPLKTERKVDKTSAYRKYLRLGQKTPKPYRVTILEHDHVRLCEDELIKIMPYSLFVIDESHKVRSGGRSPPTRVHDAHSLFVVALKTGIATDPAQQRHVASGTVVGGLGGHEWNMDHRFQDLPYAMVAGLVLGLGSCQPTKRLGGSERSRRPVARHWR